MRTCEGKTKVIVHDYLDVNVPILVAQYNKRRVELSLLAERPTCGTELT